jgi:hypothetical protein
VAATSPIESKAAAANVWPLREIRNVRSPQVGAAQKPARSVAFLYDKSKNVNRWQVAADVNLSKATQATAQARA